MRSAILKDDINEIDLLLQQLGKTPFVNKERPTPLDEALSIIFYLRYVYYDTIGELYKKLKQSFGSESFDIHQDVFQLGFWPGGDRDGNPFVTADVTLKVANELRNSILKNYYNHLKDLRRRLSFRGVSEILEKLSNELYNNIFKNENSISSETILKYLSEAEHILKTQHNGLFTNILVDYRDRVKIFGTHFATLDIRQDSRIHQKVIDELVTKYSKQNVAELTNSEKVNILISEHIKANPNDFEDEIIRETLKSVINVKEIQAKNGERGMHRYIISNSDTVEDVMNVFALFKVCGYQDKDINIDIVPLFETMEGLANAEKVMQDLYNDEVYQKHLAKRKKSRQLCSAFLMELKMVVI